MSVAGFTGPLTDSASVREVREDRERLYEGLLKILHEQNPQVKDDIARTLLEGRSV